MSHLYYSTFGAFLLWLLVSPIAAQKRMSDTQFDELKGEVKTVIVREKTILLTVSGLKEEFRRFVTVSDYDRLGNKLLVRSYGTKRATQYFHFQDSIVTVEEELKEPDELSDALLLVQPMFQKPDSLTQQSMPQIKIVRDEKGRIIEQAHYQLDGRQAAKTTYMYDGNGRIVEWRLVGPITGPKITTLLYDKAGVLLEWKQTDEQSKYTYTIDYSEYKFDSHGNWIERLETTSQPASRGNSRPPRASRFYRTIAYHPQR